MAEWWKLNGWFGRDADLKETAKAYRIVFNSPGAKSYVLPDIMEFCGVGLPLPLDPAKAQRVAGKQDVWNHLQQYLNLSETEAYAIQKGQPIVKQPVGEV